MMPRLNKRLDGNRKLCCPTQVRALLLPMRGYEVEGEDGCFVLAFHTPEEAVEYAVLLLRLLRSATWNERLTSLPECSPVMDDSGDVLLVGPRLKVGMCTGDTQVCQPSMRTGRTEYFGWVMNHAARVASTASGGQTLVHGGTFSALKLQQLDPSIKLKYRGSYQLKGIRSRVPIFEVRLSL